MVSKIQPKIWKKIIIKNLIEVIIDFNLKSALAHNSVKNDGPNSRIKVPSDRELDFLRG